jgi:hypothetical protein
MYRKNLFFALVMDGFKLNFLFWKYAGYIVHQGEYKVRNIRPENLRWSSKGATGVCATNCRHVHTSCAGRAPYNGSSGAIIGGRRPFPRS